MIRVNARPVRIGASGKLRAERAFRLVTVRKPDVFAGRMLPSHSGSFRLFKFAGIQVYLHWSWFLVAVFELYARADRYASPLWNVAEYLMLFVIVTMHEYGHALACRQTGGVAHEIVLWPLGGVAFVSPPPRPGATLWSIAAGPLVNVALAPVLFGALILAARAGWAETNPDVTRFLFDMAWLNLGLLIFNLLPIYPLDGGQMLRSVLWFSLGRARSLQIAATVGLVALAALVGWQLIASGGQIRIWPLLMALFVGQQCWLGLKEARLMMALQRLPRHTGFACPACHLAPPGGPLWACGHCGRPFDPFSTRAVCPHCGAAQARTPCVHCGTPSPLEAWRQDKPPIIDV